MVAAGPPDVTFAKCGTLHMISQICHADGHLHASVSPLQVGSISLFGDLQGWQGGEGWRGAELLSFLLTFHSHEVALSLHFPALFCLWLHCISRLCTCVSPTFADRVAGLLWNPSLGSAVSTRPAGEILIMEGRWWLHAGRKADAAQVRYPQSG